MRIVQRAGFCSFSFLIILILDFLLGYAPSAIANESFLYAANLCQRSISGFQIEEDGSLSQLPQFPLGSVAHRLIVNPAIPALYAANIGAPGNQTRAYRATANGDLQEYKTLQLGGLVSGLAIHAPKAKLYRAGRSRLGSTLGMSSLGFFSGPDTCTEEVTYYEDRDNLAAIPLLENGGFGEPQEHVMENSISSLAVDDEGEFLFAGGFGGSYRIDTFRLDKDGFIVHPPVHTLFKHDFISHFMIVAAVDQQRYLFSVDGDQRRAFGLSIFTINVDGSLLQQGDTVDTGFDIRGIASLQLKTGEVILYLAHFGDGAEDSNNITVLRLEKGPRVVRLQVLPLPAGQGDPFYRRPGGVAATRTHLYVTNFGFNEKRPGVRRGSVLVYTILEDGTINPEPLQEIGSRCNGTAWPAIVNIK